MPIISGATAPTFDGPGMTATGLAAPSRGAAQTCAWRAIIGPGAAGHEHAVDREEVFVVLSGTATATLDGDTHSLTAGDALIVPPHTPFTLANPHGEPLELVCVLPVGGRAIVADGEPFTPPWAR